MTKNNRAIVVTGTPGTGKTTVARRLAKIAGLTYVDVNNVISSHHLSEGIDRKRKCRIIDTAKLNNVLLKMIKTSDDVLVIDSHLSHFLPKNAVRGCIVTRCGLKTLNRRLNKRGYLESKVKENIQCEIFEVCLTEAKERGHNVFIVETDKKVDYEKILRKMRIKKN